MRPHGALGGKTLAEVYKPCHRPPVVRLPTYRPEYTVRRVNHQGVIKLNGDCLYLNFSLRHRLGGLQHENALRWHAWFHDVDLGTIEIANINDALQVVSSGINCTEPKQDTPTPISVNA